MGSLLIASFCNFIRDSLFFIILSTGIICSKLSKFLYNSQVLSCSKILVAYSINSGLFLNSIISIADSTCSLQSFSLLKFPKKYHSKNELSC